MAYLEAVNAAGDESMPRAVREAVHGLASRNVQLLDVARGVLAVLDGTDVDSGTAAEIGYAFARKIPIVGVRMDIRRTGELGAVINAQVQHFIESSGGFVLTCDPREYHSPTRFLDAAAATLARAATQPPGRSS